MEVILVIYFISFIWAFAFSGWACEHEISFGAFMFTIFCPILNTIFAVYRTYRFLKNKDRFFLKDLFEK